MPKQSLNKWLAILLFLLLGTSIVSFILYGPYYSPDTVNYFHFSKNIFKDHPWSNIYSPLYPFLLYCLTVVPYLSLFKSASLLILIQYGLSLFFLVQIAKTHTAHFRFNFNNHLTFLFLILIVYHSWWSFRIATWAHADGFFYTLLLSWFFFLNRYFLKGSLTSNLVLSFLSAVMLWLKLNALALIPFFLLLIFVEKKKSKWLFPLFTTIASYIAYRFFFPKNLFNDLLQHSFYDRYLSLESLEIGGNNLAELFKSTVGFFLSDVLAAYIPPIPATLGGSLTLALMIFLAVKEVKKGISLPTLALLFSLIYLLCLLAFQQMIFFEEINYRTLFPFFIGFSWYVWIKLMRLGKNSRTVILFLALLVTSHSLLGHLWLWKRQEVNALFEVERLAQSDMMKTIQNLQDRTLQKVSFASDRPEQLALLLNDPFVVPYDPGFRFIHGKRRTIPEQQRQRNRAVIQEKLLSGEAVVVIFGEDEILIQFARENGLMVADYAEGAVLYKE